MKLTYLFPHKLKRLGWILFVPSVLIGVYALIYDFPELSFLSLDNPIVREGSGIGNAKSDNFSNELLAIFLIVSSFLVAFSREKVEDEFIAQIRLDSLAWAVYFNYAVLLLSVLLFYNFDFLTVLILNMFSTLLFFIVRFNWMLIKLRDKS